MGEYSREMIHKKFFQNLDLLFQNLDVVLSIGLIFISLLLVAFSILKARPAYSILGLFMVFTGIIWLYSRKKSFIKFNSDYTNFILLNICFFIFLLLSLLILYFRADNYVRPLSYFIIISLLAGIIALEIFFSSSRRYNIYILIQIIIIGLSISLSQLLLFPSIIGYDPWWHQAFVSMIIKSGYIPSLGYSYERIPLFHLLITNTSLITGLNYKLSSIISVTFPLIVIGALIVYNFGRYLINDKIGLLGALILVLSNYVINGEIWTIPTTLAGIFLLTIIYLLLNFEDRKNFINPFLVLFLMFALILTHTIVSAIMAVILFTAWFSIFIYNYSYKKSDILNKKIKFKIPLSLVLCFTVIMFCWWMYASNILTNIADIINWGLKVDPSLANTSQEVLMYLSTIDLSQQIFNNLAIFIIFSLSIFGFFFLISKRNTSEKRFLFAFIAIMPLVISFLTIVSGYSIIQARWLFIAEILLAIPAAVTLSFIINLLSNDKLKVVLLFGTVFTLSFFMIMNSNVSDIDNNQFYSDGAVRYAFTDSELVSFETITALNTSFKTDEYYLSMDPNLLDRSYGADEPGPYPFSEELYYKNITNNANSIILLRTEMEKNPFILYGTIYKVNYDIIDKKQDNLLLLYDSGSVEGFMEI